MTIDCLASGSSGNAYLIGNGNRGEYVLLECGLAFSKLQQAFIERNINIWQIKAVIVSHFHGDHSKSLDKFQDLKIPCFSLKNKIYDDATFKVCSWLSVKCFLVIHDLENYGFVFTETDTKEKLCYITDTYMLNLKSKTKFDYVMIECNHLKSIVQSKDGFKYQRQQRYHLSLLNCKRMLNKMNLLKCKTIYAIHLSKECADPEIIKKELEFTYKIPIKVCKAEGGYY